MSFKLDSPEISRWWVEILSYRANTTDLFSFFGDGYPKPLFGQWRMRVQGIPTQECYNYLQTCGYECNVSGEMILSTKEKDQYLDFIKLMGIEREL